MPRRYRKRATVPLSKRFWPKVNKTNTCWLWTAATNGGGRYGWIKNDVGVITAAHRASWELANGAVPDGLQVLHKCDVTLCVNPAHLFLGTIQDNATDKKVKGRARGAVGVRNPSAKLSEDDVRAIRVATGTQESIAARFGIGQTVVSNIKNGRLWRHVAR